LFRSPPLIRRVTVFLLPQASRESMALFTQTMESVYQVEPPLNETDGTHRTYCKSPLGTKETWQERRATPPLSLFQTLSTVTLSTLSVMAGRREANARIANNVFIA